MLRSNTTTDKYKLNATTSLTVKNEPLRPSETGDSPLYKTTVTLKHADLIKKPLTFASQNDIQTFIDDLDLDDEQQAMPLENAA